MLLRLFCVVGAALLVALPAAAQTPDAPAAAQTPDTTTGNRLRVFLDCSTDCFEQFLRTETTWADFVREPQAADVHVLISRQETGGGGFSYTLRFVGLDRFAGTETELRAVTIADEPEAGRRRAVLQTLTVGLLGFAAREGLSPDVRLAVESSDEGRQESAATDPWNYWVFSLGLDASYQSEETNRERTFDFEVTADRVTDRWKMSFGLTSEDRKESFDLDEGGELNVRRRERSFNWFIAKSLGEHWSFGIDGDTESSTFGNVELLVGVAPAIEFNLFPYTQYATRQLRFEYAVGYEHSRYYEVTFFDRLRETRPQHEISVTLDQREPWGTLQAGLDWSQYLHDLSKSRLEVEGELSLRITRGLSFDIQGTASRIRDQLSLPRRGATPEEVLLRLRELQSGHEVDVSIGLSYRFGSIFNNIVNPRFGR